MILEQLPHLCTTHIQIIVRSLSTALTQIQPQRPGRFSNASQGHLWVDLCFKKQTLNTVMILVCKSWWGKLKLPAKPQHNTKQYISCTIVVTNGAHKLLSPTESCPNNRAFFSAPWSESLPLMHLAISRALSGSKTVIQTNFTPFKKKHN